VADCARKCCNMGFDLASHFISSWIYACIRLPRAGRVARD
jgi:hypothetical protein